jgi:uncharacterized membrane protein
MNWLGGMALGALAMYIADPAEGRRRRALLQDKVTHYSRETQRMVGGTIRDARNRLTGLQAETLRKLVPRQAKSIDNHVLEARVRSRVARAIPEAEDIEVEADEGVITLRGDVGNEIEQKLMTLVEGIPGVEAVSHDMRTSADDAGGGMASPWAERRTVWIVGAIGAGLLTWYGLTRRQPLGWLAAATGMGLLARSNRRHERGRTGTTVLHAEAIDETRQSFNAERSIEIHAASDVVYDVCSRYENFPHFMSHVIEVRDLGQQRSHWIVQGPDGTEVEFDSRLTESERPYRIGWRSEPGSAVDSEGLVVLQPQGTGTRVTVRLSWQPPAGAIDKSLAVLTGTDPESALDEDLQRLKQFIERGLPTRENKSGSAVLH